MKYGEDQLIFLCCKQNIVYQNTVKTLFKFYFLFLRMAKNAKQQLGFQILHMDQIKISTFPKVSSLASLAVLKYCTVLNVSHAICFFYFFLVSLLLEIIILQCMIEAFFFHRKWPKVYAQNIIHRIIGHVTSFCTAANSEFSYVTKLAYINRVSILKSLK